MMLTASYSLHAV